VVGRGRMSIDLDSGYIRADILCIREEHQGKKHQEHLERTWTLLLAIVLCADVQRSYYPYLIVVSLVVSPHIIMGM